MRWFLDTNVWIEAAAGVAHATNAVLKAATIDWCGYSAITRLEVFGFPQLTLADEKQLAELLAEFHEVPVSTAVIEAAIRLRRQGKIKVPDAIIAASAAVAQADLVTRNMTDFKGVQGLNVLDPITL